MEEKSSQISERLLDYGVSIIKIYNRISDSEVGKHIGKQLLRSGTSIGANYEEACGAESKADFIHKIRIILKETRETLYWLKLIQRSGLLKGDKGEVKGDKDGIKGEFEKNLKKQTEKSNDEVDIVKIIEETSQLSKIFGKSIITAREKNDK